MVECNVQQIQPMHSQKLITDQDNARLLDQEDFSFSHGDRRIKSRENIKMEGALEVISSYRTGLRLVLRHE